jgi:hypothetical protein
LITVHLVMHQYGQSQGTGNINSKRDPNWTVEAINEAMKGKSRPSISSRMKSRYIFVILLLGLTILENQFFNDLYQRDDRLADLLFSKIQSKTNQTS